MFSSDGSQAQWCTLDGSRSQQWIPGTVVDLRQGWISGTVMLSNSGGSQVQWWTLEAVVDLRWC